MHLSEIVLDSKLAQNPYEIHRHLWQLFPSLSEDKRSFLYRVSYGKHNGPLRILMQSFHEPTASANSRGCVILRKKAFTLALKAQDSLRFLLCANPTKRLVKERCRVPLIDDEAQRVWLGRKLAHAAALEALVIDRKLPLYFRKQKDQLTGKIQPVIYQGILKVQNPEALRSLIQDGIGPAKAFGCGLLSLARA